VLLKNVANLLPAEKFFKFLTFIQRPFFFAVLY